MRFFPILRLNQESYFNVKKSFWVEIKSNNLAISVPIIKTFLVNFSGIAFTEVANFYETLNSLAVTCLVFQKRMKWYKRTSWCKRSYSDSNLDGSY